MLSNNLQVSRLPLTDREAPINENHQHWKPILHFQSFVWRKQTPKTGKIEKERKKKPQRQQNKSIEVKQKETRPHVQRCFLSAQKRSFKVF